MKDPNCDYCPKCGNEVGTKGVCLACSREVEKTIAVHLTLAELRLVEFMVMDLVIRSINNQVVTDQLCQFGDTRVGKKVEKAIEVYKTCYGE